MTETVTYSVEQLPPRLRRKVYVNEVTGCWEWVASRVDGYGQVRMLGRVVKAHRVVFELYVHAVRSGRELDHLCRNPPCVNPAHLESVTPEENARRARAVRLALMVEVPRLLPDIPSPESDPVILRDLLTAMGADFRQHSAVLCRRLAAQQPERYGGLTPSRLAKELRGFGIKTRQVRAGEAQRINGRGVTRVDLISALANSAGAA